MPSSSSSPHTPTELFAALLTALAPDSASSPAPMSSPPIGRPRRPIVRKKSAPLPPSTSADPSLNWITAEPPPRFSRADLRTHAVVLPRGKRSPAPASAPTTPVDATAPTLARRRLSYQHKRDDVEEEEEEREEDDDHDAAAAAAAAYTSPPAPFFAPAEAAVTVPLLATPSPRYIHRAGDHDHDHDQNPHPHPHDNDEKEETRKRPRRNVPPALLLRSRSGARDASKSPSPPSTSPPPIISPRLRAFFGSVLRRGSIVVGKVHAPPAAAPVPAAAAAATADA